MQSALPIEWKIEKNVTSIGVLLLAGATLIPMPIANASTTESLTLYKKDAIPAVAMRSHTLGLQDDVIKQRAQLSASGESELLAENLAQSRSVEKELKRQPIKSKPSENTPIKTQSIDNQAVKSETTGNQAVTAPIQAANTGELVQKILKTAEGWLGTPYLYGGTTRNGVDCSAFVQNVFKANGINLPRTSREQFRVGIGIPQSQLKPGDLVFFNTLGSGISHVGIYLGNDEFVSATRDMVKIQSLKDGYWSRTYRGSRRVIP